MNFKAHWNNQNCAHQNFLYTFIGFKVSKNNYEISHQIRVDLKKTSVRDCIICRGSYQHNLGAIAAKLQSVL